MFDHGTIVTLGIVGAGALIGLGAEYLVRCFRVLAPLRYVAFAVVFAVALYVASLMLQGRHVNPSTHRAFIALLIALATVVAARIAGTLVMRHSQRAAGAIGSISLF